jgi:hypothetical protein
MLRVHHQTTDWFQMFCESEVPQHLAYRSASHGAAVKSTAHLLKPSDRIPTLNIPSYMRVDTHFAELSMYQSFQNSIQRFDQVVKDRAGRLLYL